MREQVGSSDIKRQRRSFFKLKPHYLSQSLLVSVKCNDNQKVPGTVSPIRVVLDFTIIILLVFCEPKNFVP